MSAAPILERLEALPKARQVSGAWRACCPAHEDSNPSLGWTAGTDGRVLVKCHASCTTESIVAALGMTLADLFDRTNGHAYGAPVRFPKPEAGPAVRTREYRATDTAGRTFTHARPEDANGHKAGGTPWQPTGVVLADLRPYGAECIADWPAEAPIILAEGEATADTLREHGYAALATFGTSYRPTPEALADLRDRTIILWPDADPGGRAHMLDMAGRLDGIATATSWIEPPADVFTGWDAANATPEQVKTLIQAAGPLPTVAARSIGSRTALDLRWGEAAPQLAGSFLTSEGATVIYARGGTGKGLLACWLTMQLIRSGHVVMILDFEGHEREWGSRLRGLGMTDAELSQVHYRAPFGADWTAETGALSKVALMIREDAERLGVTYLMVDSYSVATSNGDTMGGEAAAREYFSALAVIGRPSGTIAHVRGDSGKFPERPFGSVFVHNLARETWAVERIGDDEPETDPDLIRFGPNVVAVELRNRKANGRAMAPAQFVTFSIFADGTIEVTTERPSGRTVSDLAAGVLGEGPMTLARIAAAIKEDTGEKVEQTTLRRALARHPQRFIERPGKRPHEWEVR